jgi:hypothetical protein
MPADFEYHYGTDHPVAVSLHDGKVWVTLADGRDISNPLEWHPWLANATPEQLAQVELDAFSVYWPTLDEGLDVEGMLRGIRPRTLPVTENASAG